MGVRERRRGFGLSFVSEVPLPSLAPDPRGDATPSDTRVRKSSVAEIASAWPDGGERLASEGIPGDPSERVVERDPAAGYRLRAPGFGEALIAPDGSELLAARGDASAARFERFLVGRALPWTALIRGIELLHGAAVVRHGRALVLIGPSGVGKTSLVVQLTLAGHRFITDDVLAVDRDPAGELVVHAGARVAGLRDAERARLGRSERAALGALSGLDGKAYATFAPVLEPVPLGAIVFIARTEDRTAPALEPIPAPDPSPLLASTFVVSLQTPERLRRLLDLCADVATSVPQSRAWIHPGRDAASLAAAILSTI